MTKFDPKSTAGRTAVHESTAAGSDMTPEEERVLRMRAGATVPDDAPLGTKLDGVAPEARAEADPRLRLIEAAVLEALARAGEELDGDGAAGGPGDGVDAARKARIVAALKKLPSAN